MLRQGYSLAEIIVIGSIVAMTCIAALALYRPQLGFEWPDLGVVEMAQGALRRWRA
jgi:hypothetical protein